MMTSVEINDSVVVKPFCSFDVNRSCWRANVDLMNWTYASQMSPVIAMMTLFMVVGLIGNTFVMTIYLIMKQRTTAQLFMLCLAIIDLLNCLIIHPYVIFKIFHNYDQTWGEACKVFEFVGHTNLGLSALSLLVVAVDRFMAICRPVKFLIFRHNVSKLMICATLIAILFSAPILEFYGAVPITEELEDITIIHYWCHFQHKYEKESVAMFTFSLFIMSCFVVEVIALVVLYWLVALTAYHSRRSIMPMASSGMTAPIPSTSISFIASTEHGSSDRNLSPPDNFQTTFQHRRIVLSHLSKKQPLVHARSKGEDWTTSAEPRLNKLQASQPSNNRVNTQRTISKQECGKIITNRYLGTQSFQSRLKAAKILFLVTAVFFASYMPFFVLRICLALNTEFSKNASETRQVVEHMVNHFFYLNNTINPIIYTLINANFRQECKRLWRKRWRCF